VDTEICGECGQPLVHKADYDALAAQHDLTVQLLAEAEQDRDYWKSLVKRTPRAADKVSAVGRNRPISGGAL
jgi:hypothetical protein